MRITVVNGDPGERVFPEREVINVYLNGKEVEWCFTADDERGEVVAAVMDKDGRPCTESNEVMRETLYGEVRIERCQR